MDKYQEALYRILKGNPKAELSMSDIHKDVATLYELIYRVHRLENENEKLRAELSQYKNSTICFTYGD